MQEIWQPGKDAAETQAQQATSNHISTSWLAGGNVLGPAPIRLLCVGLSAIKS